MKINTSLALRQPLILEETLDFSSLDMRANVSLKGIDNLHVKTTTQLSGNLFKVDVILDCELTLECAYTLDLFKQDLHLDDTLFFSTSDEDEGEDVFFEKGPQIDFDPYVYGLILAEVPLRVIKPGATLPKGSDNIVIQSEDEYYQERANRPTPFDDLNLDDFPD